MKKVTASENQIVSKQRVTDHGEVFTHEREVNAMLDLVKQETHRIDSRFLEPACGTGNFLAEVLTRKLEIVEKRYKKSQIEFEKHSIIAVSSLYGVDILKDNVKACRDRLFKIFNETYTNLYKKKCKDSCRRAVKFLLIRNILWGDALDLKTPDEDKNPIVFSEWSIVSDKIKRRDFKYAELAEFDPKRPSLFHLREVSDTGDTVFSPMPVMEFPLIHYLKLGQK